MTEMELLKILDKVGISANANTFTQYDIEECDAFWEFHNYMRKNYSNFEYHIATGATKAVIVPHNEDWVLKIPFAGYCDYDEQPCWEDEETGEWIYDEDWDPFEPYDIDYCQTEAENYFNSTIEGISECFAAVEYLGNAGYFPVYRQEKVKTFWTSEHKKHTLEEINNFKKSYNGGDIERLPEEWCLDFIECYGEEMFIDMLIFTMDYHINDLHGDNVAYRNSKPVLSDYSGFWN